MSKKTPVIPVKVTGKVSAHVVSIDYGTIAKSSAQIEDSKTRYSTYLPPPVSAKVAIQFYNQHPYHARAITLKALCIAGIGYDINPIDAKDEDYFDDPEYLKLKAFCDNPNLEAEVFEDLIINWLTERYIHGQGYLEIVPNAKGELAEIYNLRSFNCFPKLYYNNLYYFQKNLNKDVWFQPFNSGLNVPQSVSQKQLNEVLVLKNYNPETKYFGLPEWYSATGDLVLDRSVIEYRIREFENNLLIQFIIICEGGEIDEDGLSMVQKFLSSNFKGVQNAGKVLYLNSDHPEVKIRIEKIDKDIREAGYISTREQSRDFILAADGVPSILLGAKTKGQLGGTTELKDMFNILNETIIKPQKKTTESKLNQLFRLRLGITKFKLLFKELTVDSLAEIVEYVSKMKDAGIIGENEARQEIGYEPRDAGTEENDVLNKLYKISSEVREIRKQITNVT